MATMSWCGEQEGIWEAVPDGMRITDASGTILRVNEAFCKLVGLPRAELEGRSLVCAYHEEDRAFTLEGYRNRVSAAATESRQERALRLWNGRTIWMQTSVTFLTGGLMLTVFHDISHLKQTEEATRAERQRFADLLEAMDAGTWEWTIATGAVTINERWAAIVGYRLDELQPVSIQTWRDLVHPDDLERSDQLLARHFRGELAYYECECRMRAKDGSWVWVLDRGHVIEWMPDGTPARAVGAHLDITSRKRTELQLSEASEKIRQLAQAIEQSPVSIVLCDKEAKITYVNHAFTEVTGYAVDEAIGRNPNILKSGRMNPEIYQELWTTLSTGGTWRGEMLNRKKNGDLYWEIAVIAPVVQASGEVTGYIGVKEDITARKKADEELRKANHELEQMVERARELSRQAEAASTAKSEFLANMSHEIRTPLNGVIGMCELLLATELTHEQHGYAEVIRSGGKALLTLINDILDLSRIEAGKIELSTEPVDVTSIVEQVAAILSPQAGRKGLDFQHSVFHNGSRQLMGDPARLQQVLLNLAGNAVKFTRQGHVAVAVDNISPNHSGAVLRFSVKDTGIGIPREKHARLFQKFTQLDASSAREFGGTGLGLAISKQLVKLMGGEIGVESEEGRGSHFWFTVPLAYTSWPADAPALPSMLPERPVGSGTPGWKRSARVLVVEDNAVNQRVARSLLKHLGVDADVVSDGSEAIAPVQSGRYDLVLMDIHMPNVDGYRTTSVIRSLATPWREIPVIAMTASAMAEDRDKCFAAGMNDYLTKPVSIATLRDMLTKWLGKRDSRTLQ